MTRMFGQPRLAVLVRIKPSREVIKKVFYLMEENRTSNQVYETSSEVIRNRSAFCLSNIVDLTITELKAGSR